MKPYQSVFSPMTVVLPLIGLFGCEPVPEPKTVSYYEQNEVERNKVRARCRDNPGKYKDDPDCLNAEAAMMRMQGRGKYSPVEYPPLKDPRK